MISFMMPRPEIITMRKTRFNTWLRGSLETASRSYYNSHPPLEEE
jgi:hypothetical protein